MQVSQIDFDKAKAREMYDLYRSHRGAHTKEDAEIERIYYQISRGRKVIRALDSIRAAGHDELGRPLLAMVRADVKRCRLRAFQGSTKFDNADRSEVGAVQVRNWPASRWVAPEWVAMVPMIPVHLRPQAKDLPKYHILWEADWEKVPVDPMLLRKIGPDAWVVVAAWDLTAVEQAVLAGRL